MTADAFSGFSADAFAWFAGLEQDNSREYFTSTRDTYEAAVRNPLSLLLRELSDTFGGGPRVFRQQNDMRFAPASPYKTRTYGVIDFVAPERARLYADISARGLYAGTGYHRLAPDQLTRYRDAVVDDQAGARLNDVVNTVEYLGLELISESLTTTPRGYRRDHSRDELLKFRSLLVGRLETGDPGIDRERALHHVTETWHHAKALTDWLDEHVGPSTLAPRERWARRPVTTPAPTG